MAIKVVVSGTGKMGQEVLRAVCREPDLEPVGVVEKFSAEEVLSLPDDSRLIPLGNDPTALLSRSHPDVVVDFTNAEWTPILARSCLDAGVRLVTGTTGLPEAFVEELGRECRERGLGAVVAANFAIGAVLMMKFAEMAAPYFDSAEIIELHHENKVDAPSGTAMLTVERMAAASQQWTPDPTRTEVIEGARGSEGPGGIRVHSVRLRGLVAHQEVLLGTTGQTLSIRHDSIDRTSFMPGVVLAVKRVADTPGVTVGLDALLGL